MNTLSSKQRQYLKGLAHPLKPVVIIGDKGLSENVLAEVDGALEAHELIKIKLHSGEKSHRDGLIESAAKEARAEIVGTIGKIAILYRPSLKPKIVLP